MSPLTCKEQSMDRKPYSKNYFSREMCASFVETATARKYKLRSPSPHQKSEHIDFIMIGVDATQGTQSVTLDIKTIHPKSSDKWLWLEFRNIKGRPGWLYQESDFVVFERKKDFLLTNRKNLVEWVNTTNKIRHDLPTVSDPWKAKYRLYSRAGKKELISQVKAEDLLEIRGTQVWNKVS